MQFLGVDHILYYVHDLDRAKAFYRDVMGLPIMLDVPGFAGVSLGGGIWLGLHPTEMKGQDVGRGGFAYLRVADLDKTLNELRARNVAILNEPGQVPMGRLATIHDSEGNAIGLFEPAR